MKFRPPFMVQASLKHQEKPSEYFIYSPLLHIITNRPPCIFKPSTSISIPLGHSTTFLIKPKAREIDDSGKQLTESQRNCRLDKDTDELDIFNIYTRTACLFECKTRYATKRCQCIPWNYHVNMMEKVSDTLY